ncbi:MAG: hypothetical protein H0T62_01000 [Parachlamydiaceae bacterium]|nr:hypothetical protein [Parachlamydiaceae bacterium]
MNVKPTVDNYSDPYAQQLLEPLTPTPPPEPIEEEVICSPLMFEATTLALVVGLSFVVGCVATAIFSGPILATGLWLAATVTTIVLIKLSITCIGKKLNWRPSNILLLQSIATIALVILARFAAIYLSILGN